MKTSITNIALALVVLMILLSGSVFTVSQTKKALVFQFGEVVETYDTPGLKFKIPFVQSVLYFDRRLLDYNLPVIEVTAEDQKRIVVDLYARYSIEDVLLFYKTVNDVAGAENRLSTIVSASMRRVIGQVPLSQMLSPERAKIMRKIREEVFESAKSFGINVKDVRIIRADLPKENSEAIFKRMESERVQEAKQFRAEGKENAIAIRSQAERERTIILAEAERKAQVLRGQGDAESSKIYAQAFNKDKEFFSFYRSMNAYSEALTPEGTTFILSPTSEFFDFFGTKSK
ncbi:protease modulator HflC [Candidatus Nucleicultrix amoebiphila]|jgi:membrane protease subunit HflC|uniref:Protein HflC n=1 Tax=Candidatus Nucleicultrix amoebiphila FS5 TaxID=1414854 RepID=A0A1W6N4G1_9PROT|nr:protease modulator HflC [Candidatus Nucleicultrix amoebiphila]ARN84656.1 membrane protein [Candidatus Nucleicultrix amoebiphila FS5]